MARRLHQTMADYVVIAISPALIMALVGSLVFFLLRVFYQGDYQQRLHWVMACFVFAAVLIGRISIEEGLERAVMFGAALAVVMVLAANQFMEFHGGWIDNFSWLINGSLIALVWWCAHRLTWDCTVIDDAQDASGEGLLQTAGLEGPARGDPAELDAQRLEGTTSREVPHGFWQRYVEHQRRPHAPGVWVVYFSLAALPLFGIGQWLIPESDVAGRRSAFWLLSVYVASGLGLLLTTSFLGLRRYLRQRRIEMPTLMANLWLTIGAGVVLVLIVLAALLPRPSAEYSISRLPFTLGSPQQRSSRMAPIAQEGTRDEQPGSAPDRPTSDDPHESDRSTADAPAMQGKSAQGQQANQQASDETSSPPAEGEQRSQGSASSSQGQKSSGESKQADEPADFRSKIAKAIQARRDEQSKQADSSQQDPAADTPPPTDAESPPPSQSPDGESPQPTEPPSADATQGLEMAQNLVETTTSLAATVFQWVFYAVVALAALWACWRYRAEIAAAFRDLLAALRDFWNGLFGRKRRHGLSADEIGPIQIPPAPFSTYADPFATGIAGRYSIEELVRYSFEAFEAWAREHGCPRHPDQTPHELVRDVARKNTFITTDARNLAELYARAAYAQGELPRGGPDQLRELWKKMRAGVAAKS